MTATKSDFQKILEQAERAAEQERQFQSVTKGNRLKLPAADGKSYLTDVASAKTRYV